MRLTALFGVSWPLMPMCSVRGGIDKFSCVHIVCSFPELLAGFKEVPAQRAFGDAEPAGDFPLGQLADVVKHHRLPLQPAQVHHLLTHPGGQTGFLGAVGHLGGEIAGVGVGFVQGLRAVGGQLPQALEPHEAGHLPQQSLRLAQGIACGFLPSGGGEVLQPHLLGQILRLFAAAGFAPCPPEQARGCFLQQHRVDHGAPPFLGVRRVCLYSTTNAADVGRAFRLFLKCRFACSKASLAALG